MNDGKGFHYQNEPWASSNHTTPHSSHCTAPSRSSHSCKDGQKAQIHPRRLPHPGDSPQEEGSFCGPLGFCVISHVMGRVRLQQGDKRLSDHVKKNIKTLNLLYITSCNLVNLKSRELRDQSGF